ncbi:MAG: DNA ligase [Deltaproteobacteria bacterium RIFOXYA12_FULL_58_15]|nr:MAG: DNA ligase [Deltaproteobacteria bacterium RIFOXYA12_FULL_58_15]
MIAPKVLLAHRWKDEDPRGWWLSEKLDGVRAFWDGQRFLSRTGHPIYAPDWFCAELPAFPLDGELWGGRKNFQQTVSIVRRQDKSDDWRGLLYMVFDAPAAGGTFEDRCETLRREVEARKPKYARVLEQCPCTGADHLKNELNRIHNIGGEGLMLRQPGSKYFGGRSSTLLKVKVFFDTEARVIGHAPGKGKHVGRLGALEAELPDGTRFSIGTGFSDAERESPPNIGSIVTFRYQELTDDGVPRFPSYVGIRFDAVWPPDADADAVIQTPSPPPAPPPAQKAQSQRDNRRHFERTDGNVRENWDIELRGTEVWMWWGRAGAQQFNSVKLFSSEGQAKSHASVQIAKKQSKGYIEF